MDATVLQLRTPRTERNGKTILLLRTEWNKNGTIKKEERERNDLAEGPRSRTERNNFKKVGTCPALERSTVERQPIRSVDSSQLSSIQFILRQKFKI